MSDFLPILIEYFGLQRLLRSADLLLVSPLVVTTIVAALYFMFWQTDPLLRFTHMIWVLGFWMTGAITMFNFIVSLRLKFGASFQKLILSVIAIVLAIYFTSLSRFTNMFPRQTNLMLPALVGVLNLTICWFVILRFRNKVIETQTH